MANDILRIGKVLVLIEEEKDGIVIPAGVWCEMVQNIGIFLVDRFLSRFSYNFKALRSIIISIMNPMKEIDGCPWIFDKQVIILNIIEENDDLLQVDNDWCDFHIHVHELPLSKRIRDDVDLESHRGPWGLSMRLWLALNINIPLKRVMNIQKTTEKFPNFCYLCGILGCSRKYCELQFKDNLINPRLAMALGNGESTISI
ncbi:hypothetical protein Pfo_018174 [Paulownia fortunei]|nr:hypothetical protein Pfo_018174 [Paulownia fortunei]